MEALYGAVQQAGRSRGGDNAEGDAHALAAAIAAILLHLAVKRTIEQRGLPRRLAVIVGSNEDYPFFDAPVVTYDEGAQGDDLPVPQFGQDHSGPSFEAGSASKARMYLPEEYLVLAETAAAAGLADRATSGNPGKEAEARIRTANYVPRGIGAFAALGGTRQRATLDLNAPARNADGSLDTLELGHASIEVPTGTSLRRRIAAGDMDDWEEEDERRIGTRGFFSKLFFGVLAH
jgi:hypothetical protein